MTSALGSFTVVLATCRRAPRPRASLHALCRCPGAFCVSVSHAAATFEHMTTIIPPLFSQWTATFTCVGLTRNVQITMVIQPGVGLTAAQQNAAVRGALVGSTGRPFSAANMDNQWTLAETKILYRNAGGLLLTDIDVSTVVGTKVVDPLPVNTSVILRKNTGFAGKAYRGRCLLPPLYFQESDIDAAGIITGWATYNTLWDTARTTMVSNGVSPVLLHDNPALAPTAISTFSINPRIGTIGKRLRP